MRLTRPGRRDDEHSESGGSPHLTMPGHRNAKADTSEETLAGSVTAALASATPGLADAAAWRQQQVRLPREAALTPEDSGKLSSATAEDCGKAALASATPGLAGAASPASALLPVHAPEPLPPTRLQMPPPADSPTPPSY